MFVFSLLLYRRTVQRDMEESLCMWPLTCYGHAPAVRFLPELVDLSPEELRLEAYQAKSAPAQFLKNVEELIRHQTDLRTKYASITQDDLAQLVS